MKRLLTFLLIMSMASLALANTTYYVDDATGNDSDSGLTEGDAFKTVSHAEDTVIAGDLVYVKAGTYSTEHGSNDAVLQLQTPGGATNPITYTGYSSTPGDGTPGIVILDAGPNALTNAIQDGSIEGYHQFSYFRFTGASGIGVDFESHGRFSTFYGCRSDNNGSHGWYLKQHTDATLCQSDNNTGRGFVFGGSAKLDSCVIFSNSNIGAVFFEQSSISNSLIYDNTGDQLSPASTNALIKNCTIDGGGSQIGVDFGQSGAQIINCIITSCTVGIAGEAGATSNSISINNLFYDNGTDRTNWPTDASDISADPLFVGPPDYSLGTGSPALEAGIGVGVIDGITSTSYIDIGAQQAEPTGGTTVIVIDD